MEFSEEVFHYIWKYRLFTDFNLETKSGKPLVVLSPGLKNKDAGPDFEHSRLMIDQIEWAGTIEIHVKSSDWYIHSHQHDPAYNSVVLHVVYEYDKEICLQDGTVPETLELKRFVDASLLNRYEGLMRSRAWIPCQEQLATIDTFHIKQWLERVLTERLQEKCTLLTGLLTEKKNNWEEVTYILLARNFGFKVNAVPFEWLAKNTPHRLLAKYRFSRTSIEALIFGQAGMLEKERFYDDYPISLQKEYTHLRYQYNLTPLPTSIWKFLRMRPANFPTMRLAQFAAWCASEEHLFSKIITLTSVEQLRQLFRELPVNAYWRQHYVFDKVTKQHSTALGARSIDNVIINTVVTILVAYGKYVGKEMYLYRAIDLLDELTAEKNSTTNQFSELGLDVKTAADSQALLQLKQNYCDRYKCLDCGIGLQVFKQNKTL
ncbi:DUF2851 family protein [Olivibacter sp. XZL3]|uniref:DUF2851 family protein n=1 Tax=Olivibacter sp. XZL3 TaxID=1735116 RepID=UPI001066D811|nr:DUF2851 family protein [Olivibacter sp. XZL3]